ncbi:MAG: hypothetical protein QG587_935 [Chloroflexota bacterium]|nr:hypothetical protein [Chloroflexota bacterium]
MFGSRVAVRLGSLLLAVALLGACGAAAIESPATPSPTANPDVAFLDALDAVWSSPYDEAAVAALYAPDATFYSMVANETMEGLKEIQATIKEHAALNFRATTTSAPIRQDDFVAYFIKFGPDPDKYPGLSVLELKDGMILNHWVYPAP